MTFISITDFQSSIHQGCKGLAVGDYVCVAAKTPPTSTPTSSSSSYFPTQTGITPRCMSSPVSMFRKLFDQYLDTGNKWHFVTGHDSCTSIREEYGITPAEFYHWNPATGKDCTNLWRKVYVCVGVTGKNILLGSTLGAKSESLIGSSSSTNTNIPKETRSTTTAGS